MCVFKLFKIACNICNCCFYIGMLVKTALVEFLRRPQDAFKHINHLCTYDCVVLEITNNLNYLTPTAMPVLLFNYVQAAGGSFYTEALSYALATSFTDTSRKIVIKIPGIRPFFNNNYLLLGSSIAESWFT